MPEMPELVSLIAATIPLTVSLPPAMLTVVAVVSARACQGQGEAAPLFNASSVSDANRFDNTSSPAAPIV